jgi:Fur family peroxide stress response transcriptional regulator
MVFLLKHCGHPTAAEIFEAVTRRDPRCSRATTYNNLRVLVKSGLVRQLAGAGRAARFDANCARHHHFICDDCGLVEDMDWYEVPSPTPPAIGKRVFRASELICRGLCEKCAARRTRVLSIGNRGKNQHARKHQAR